MGKKVFISVWLMCFFHQMVILRNSGKDTEYVQTWLCSLKFGLTPFILVKSHQNCSWGHSLYCSVWIFVMFFKIDWSWYREQTDYQPTKHIEDFVKNLSSNLLTFSACWKVLLTLPLSYVSSSSLWRASYYTVSSKMDKSDLRTYFESTLNY